jgi:hypothetical protein
MLVKPLMVKLFNYRESRYHVSARASLGTWLAYHMPAAEVP